MNPNQYPEPNMAAKPSPKREARSHARIERINVNDPRLRPAPAHAQRPWNKSNAMAKAAKFNCNALGMAIGSERDDLIFLLDGQHRVGAARMVGWDGYITVQVWTGLTHQEEADFFLTHNDQKHVSTFDKFKVRIARGDTSPVAVKDVLDIYGWRLATGSHEGSFAAVSTAERVVDRWGATMFSKVMRTVTAAWGHTASGAHANIVLGLAEFYSEFGESAAEDRVVEMLRTVAPASIRAHIKPIIDGFDCTPSLATAEAVRRLYNTRLKTKKLPRFLNSR